MIVAKRELPRSENKLEDILVQIKKKKSIRTGHVVTQNYNRWTTMATNWVPRDGTIRKERLITQLREKKNIWRR